MRNSLENPIKLEHEVNPRLGVDSYIYSTKNSILTYKSSHQKLPSGSIIEGASVALFNENKHYFSSTAHIETEKPNQLT